MVHHEGMPAARMKVETVPTRSPQEIMQQRAADVAKIAEFKRAQEAIAKGEVGSVEEYYAKQDAAAAAEEPEEVVVARPPLPGPRMNPRARALAEAAAQQPATQEVTAPVLEVVPAAKPKVAEISGDAAVFARMEGKSINQMDSEERALYAKMMKANAERARERMVKAQATSKEIVSVRDRLLRIPDAVAPSRKLERPSMPKVDGQRVYNTEYGPLMILSVDEARGVMYFATPEERRKVDAALVRDEGQSSLGAANFENVLELTVEQARRMLENAAEAPVQAMTQKVEAQQPPAGQHLQGRYRAAA